MLVESNPSAQNRPLGPGGKIGKPPKKAHQRLAIWDRALVRRWQRLTLPDRWHRWLVLFVRIGDGWGWALVAAALAWFLPWTRFKMVVGQSLLAVAISLPIYWGIKLGFRRSRPFSLARKFAPRVPPLDKYSFPSGHTMNNLAVAMTLALHIPALWPLAMAVPVSLGLLRVLYGVHFVTDILAGAFLGALSAFWAHWLFPGMLS
jgi:undecaprenyl-diphosphatase